MTKQQRLNRLYSKERAKVRQRIRKAEKEGYSGVVLPNKPKRITEASIRKMQSYTSKYINERMTKTVDGQEITRRQGIIRSRWNRPKKQKIEITLPQAEPTPVNIPILDIFETATETFNEIDFLLDKVKQNIDYIENLPEDESHTRWYRDGSTTKSTKQEVVEILKRRYYELVSACAGKKPLPEDVFEELKALANDEFFSLDYYGYTETEVADPLCAKMIQLAEALDNDELAEKANELATDDEGFIEYDGSMDFLFGM